MTPPRRRIALDFSTLDHGTVGGGQFRYGVDLMSELASLSHPFEFVLLGSKPTPPEPVRELFQTPELPWLYHRLRRFSGRGSEYLNQALIAWQLGRLRIQLLHQLHTFVPLFAPCPVVVTKYDLMEELFPEYDAWQRTRPYRIHRWSVRHRTRRIIAISEGTAADLKSRWGIGSARLRVVQLGTRFRGTTAAGADGAEAACLRVLSPYNLEPRKNLPALVEALQLLRGEFPGLELHLFGRAAVTAERERRFEELVQRLGVESAVKRLGFVDDAALNELYRSSTIFVFPSLYEGFGLPVVEAMAAGGCVVVRNTSAMAEIVGEAGMVVETKDPATLAAAMRDLLRDPAKRLGLREAGRRRAMKFTAARMARETLAVYREALGMDG